MVRGEIRFRVIDPRASLFDRLEGLWLRREEREIRSAGNVGFWWLRGQTGGPDERWKEGRLCDFQEGDRAGS